MSAPTPPAEPKVLTQLYIPAPLYRRLKAEAWQRGISMAALVRELLTVALMQEHQKGTGR